MSATEQCYATTVTLNLDIDIELRYFQLTITIHLTFYSCFLHVNLHDRRAVLSACIIDCHS